MFPLTGKTAAMVALLASAPNGRRTRSWLQDMLWPRSGWQHGRASLRQSLAGLKRTLGPKHVSILGANNQEIWLNLDLVSFVGSPHEGVLLEGLNPAGADGFEAWLKDQRRRIVAGLDSDIRSNFRTLPASPVPQPEAASEKVQRFTKLRPAIAILPFSHATSDQIDPVFGDMIAGDLSRMIARAHGIDVISHLSCRSTGFLNADLERLNTLYGVDYVATGFLRDARGQMTLDIEFTDSASGMIVNTKRFSRSSKDWLRGSADILQEIANYIVDSLFKGALRDIRTKNTEDVASHSLLMSAIALMHRQDLASVLRSHKFLESILDQRGPSSLAYAWLAQWYVLFLAQGWGTNIEDEKLAARDMVSRALESDPDCSFSQVMDGVVSYQLERDYEGASVTFEKVLAENENNAVAWYWKGIKYAFEGDGQQAIAYTDCGRRLTPLDPGGYLYKNLSATAHLSGRNFQSALDLANESLSLNRHHASAIRAKIIALNGLNRFDSARATAREMLQMYPKYTIENYLSAHPAAELEIGQEWAQALESSGIPRR
ncbi:hypothetical protein E1180_14135 [Roseibium denhamense]|uniref:hypothetical protein n=1 Tax=Roseibium denhamense TaxID=76305 RepID=UPI0012BBA30C|nr:hypothetical protein [Roseibium denhamense]MTI06656.1 hypothetical protein [Roseibium denhamense]